MPFPSDELSDKHVAELLAKEASEAGARHSVIGVAAYKHSTKQEIKAKPNTRFLQKLLKVTESHNTALTAKEVADSQTRLRELSRVENAKRKKYKPDPTDIRRRQLGNIMSIIGGESQAHDGSNARPAPCSNHASTQPSGVGKQPCHEYDKKRLRAPPSSASDAEIDHQHCSCTRKRRCSECGENSPRKRSRSSRSDHQESARPSRNMSYSDNHCANPKHMGKSWSESPCFQSTSRITRDKQRDSNCVRHFEQSPFEGDSTGASNISNRNNDKKLASTSNGPDRLPGDSDSDSDLIGPNLPSASITLRRGRGEVRMSSGIDRRFSASYDPKADLEDADEHGGRSEHTPLLKVHQGIHEKSPELRGADDILVGADMRWAKKGEKREWDRGKVVAPDGSVIVITGWSQECPEVE